MAKYEVTVEHCMEYVYLVDASSEAEAKAKVDAGEQYDLVSENEIEWFISGAREVELEDIE